MTIIEDNASDEDLMEQDHATSSSEDDDDDCSDVLDYDDDDDEEDEVEETAAVAASTSEQGAPRVIRRTYIPNSSSRVTEHQGAPETENEAEEEEMELECDLSAYVMYHKAETGFPCLSFDILQDGLGSDPARVDKFPQSSYLVAGTQADKVQLNKLLVLKMANMNPVKKNRGGDDNDEDEESEDDDDDEQLPDLHCISIPHAGCVNRVRSKKIGNRTIAATFSELGVVHLWDLEKSLEAVESSSAISRYNKHYEKKPEKPFYSFSGHSDQGYAIDWSEADVGTLATGDCKKHVFIWKLAEAGWQVDQLPLIGHTGSVEDLQWSPNEPNIIASCSVDRTIRVWDIRTRATPAITVPEAHSSDVNVISWNRTEQAFIVSGGDDGAVKVWDLRQFKPTNQSSIKPLAVFKHHTAPITSVEWHPVDGTVFAASSDDNQITLWDLAVEPDADSNNVPTEEVISTEDDQAVNQLPPQLLFIHQGQKEVKEIHWHPQLPGVLVSTALSGFDIFRTISV